MMNGNAVRSLRRRTWIAGECILLNGSGFRLIRQFFSVMMGGVKRLPDSLQKCPEAGDRIRAGIRK